MSEEDRMIFLCQTLALAIVTHNCREGWTVVKQSTGSSVFLVENWGTKCSVFSWVIVGEVHYGLQCLAYLQFQ